MTISDKLNEIEERTRELAGEAQELAEWKAGLDALLECEVHDHDWNLGGVTSNLREVHMIHIGCERCKCYIMTTNNHPVTHHTEVLVRDLIPEEDE